MLLKKFKGNPILFPNVENSWENLVVCNPAAYVSYMTVVPTSKQIAQNTCNKQIWRDETRDLKGVAWYKNFRVLCLILAALALIEYLVFL
jgi:hypothetical protein